MGFFSSILDMLGLKSAQAQPSAARPPAATPQPATVLAPAAPPPPAPIPVVDVVSHLEKVAAANPQKLNWKTSIVDAQRTWLPAAAFSE